MTGQPDFPDLLDGDRLLTVLEVALALRTSNMTIYRLVKSGKLPAIKVGKNLKFRESLVRKYLVEQEIAGLE